MKKTTPRQIRFPDELWNKLAKQADLEHSNSSEIVRRLVIDYLKKVEGEKPKTDNDDCPF